MYRIVKRQHYRRLLAHQQWDGKRTEETAWLGFGMVSKGEMGTENDRRIGQGKRYLPK
jgi:hypothetical protein